MREPERSKPARAPRPLTGEFTADFRHEFDVETRQLLRSQFLWFDGLVGGLWALMLGLTIYRLLAGDGLGLFNGAVNINMGSVARSDPLRTARLIAAPIFDLVALAAYAATFIAVKRGRFIDRDLLRLTFALVLMDGSLRVVMDHLNVTGGFGLWGLMLAHALACTFLPWTPRQAIMPVLPVLALNALLTLVFDKDPFGWRIFTSAFSAFFVVPGVFIAWLRHSRRVDTYRTRFLQRRYGELRRELVDARRIHESLFPPPRSAGPIRFAYRYEPMRQIGGDYLYAAFGPDTAGRPDGALSVVVLDVTGHGIPAALTVNRLHGELERVFAENRGVTPGEVLRLLNRYVHLTLANHSVYVTALCVKADCAADTLTYASGGHPPAFLRAVDGSVEHLNSTAFVLGACPDPEFDPEPVTLRFGPGDSLIAYTDGAIEARDSRGKMLGVQGFFKLVASLSTQAPDEWSEILLRTVESHRDGPPSDDTLVIEITRPV